MKITKIETQKHNPQKANVYVDGEYKFALSVKGCAENYLYEGREITEKQIAQFSDMDTKNLASNYLTYLLNFGMKTESELREKMRKKDYSTCDIDFAIDKAKRYGYVDDVNYVKCYIQQRANQNGWGPNKVIGMLLQKGVDRAIIQEGIDKYMSNDDLYNTVLELGMKKYASLDKGKNTPKQCREKVLRHLLSKGFTYDLCIQVVSNVLAFSEESTD